MESRIHLAYQDALRLAEELHSETLAPGLAWDGGLG